jgi:hypothetical protein
MVSADCLIQRHLLNVKQSSESRLYTFSQESKDHLRKFRLGTSRSNDPQAVICMFAPLQFLGGMARLSPMV